MDPISQIISDPIPAIAPEPIKETQGQVKLHPRAAAKFSRKEFSQFTVLL
jgi:hypothetical protein